jgi:DNA-binding response OmpR family regulator
MPKTILVVDDEPALLTALFDKFTRAGFSVIVAENGQEGLKSALINHPDLILLDIIMPVMSGLAMLNELRTDDWGKQAKVILLTNLSDPIRIDAHISQTILANLIKSDWKIEDVVKKVIELLAN